ncbi:response regulator transcription factor [Comamonas composti]|uniref:response regulator transcription factor n=1 Tax=Comamonas composti TaxID=408558 RepID=UPI00040104A9|nr:response regulator transcription factor [Comamonas composti]
MKLLVVEDHKDLRALLQEHLERMGFAVDAVATGRQALDAMAMNTFDALILDLGLPDMDGMQVLAQCGSCRRKTPCIILTARDALQSRVAGLNQGADDYVLKPFDLAELEARVRAVLRRSQGSREHRLSLGNLAFETDSRHATVDGQALDLQRREAMLLEEMLRVWPRIVVKERMEEHLYASRESVTLNAIEALISRLRRKLRQAGADVAIDTVRGVGYRMVLPAAEHGRD